MRALRTVAPRSRRQGVVDDDRRGRSLSRLPHADGVGSSPGGGPLTVEPRVRVLIADDEPALRLLCRINLEAAGIEVLDARDGVDQPPGRARDPRGRRVLGAAAYLTKPFDPSSLAATVDRVLLHR